MPFPTAAYAAPSAGVTLQPTTIERRDVGAHDVLIDIRFCGICHTDIHRVNDDWGGGIFPMVPGHEIAGTVAATGSEVTRFSVGDRVGVGTLVDSCGACEYCLRGDEQFCPRRVGTYGSLDHDGKPTDGGYSQQIVVKDGYLVSISDALELADAAPLLCAGITTYTPLKLARPAGKSVAVVGLGGLGHVAVQIAVAMGAEVTVISQTLAKRDDGLKLGATRYYASADPETFADLTASVDLILNTVATNLDLDVYLSLLRVDGTLVNVGVPIGRESFSPLSLLSHRRSITGANSGGIRDTQEMLDFCAEHGIRPWIEQIGAGQIADAFARIVTSQVRYRVVIDAATFAEHD
jgi:alcohol dehydrogenase (NADP+)